MTIDNSDIERHVREANAWRVAFGNDMDDIRLGLAELRDGQRDLLAMMRDGQRNLLAMMQAEREMADEEWRTLARHDATLRFILRRYRRRGRKPRP